MIAMILAVVPITLMVAVAWLFRFISTVIIALAATIACSWKGSWAGPFQLDTMFSPAWLHLV
jgi:hypothetical protein